MILKRGISLESDSSLVVEKCKDTLFVWYSHLVEGNLCYMCSRIFNSSKNVVKHECDTRFNPPINVAGTNFISGCNLKYIMLLYHFNYTPEPLIFYHFACFHMKSAFLVSLQVGYNVLWRLVKRQPIGDGCYQTMCEL